ncbi:hypothetical protein ACKGJI_03785 [Sulfurospirillum sp. 1307]|jgi:ferrochelatase
MKIESLARITGGVLLNTPSVNSINKIEIDSSKVNSGSLFIDLNNSQEDMQVAISNGAYCILTSNIIKITDDEIAWINVENLELAIIKLARYYASDKNFKFIPLCKIKYNLAKYLHVKENILTLSNNPAVALLQIINAKDDSLFFIMDNSFIDKIDPTVKKPKEKIYPDKIIEKGLFYSSFIYNDLYIKDIRLPSLFVPFLCSLIDFFQKENLEFKIDNFSDFKHFHTFFVNKNLEKKEFGSTNKAIIVESDIELFKKEIEFISSRVNLDSFIIFIPSKILHEFKLDIITITYSNLNEIKKLKDINFRYLLAYSNTDDYEQIFAKQEIKQMSLF